MNGQRKRLAKGALREVATLQTLSHGAQPRGRSMLVSRFARLENERARLERELDMWRTRVSATEDRLAHIYKTIDELRPLLLETTHQAGVSYTSPKQRRARASTEVAGSTAPPSRNMLLEY